MKKVLIIEDDKSINNMLKKFLESLEIKVFQAETGINGINICKKEFPDIILLDLKLPDTYGLDIVGNLKEFTKQIIIITAHGDINDAVKATKMGVYDFIEKPIDFKKLKEIISKIYKMDTLNQKLKKSDDSYEIIGSSASTKSLIQKIQKISDKNVPVLLLGESGTGKEVLARNIHKYSKRKNFVAVNCGAIPEELFESELFGYEKGSFTGAEGEKPGKIELADKGTLFLDEIGDLPKNMQVKLLRVLETKEVDRIGSTKSRKVDIRIIAATNKNIIDLVKNNEFREDLFFRISVIEMNLLPLRERIEDLIDLIDYFVMSVNKDLNTNIDGISPEVLEVFNNYEWFGNIRELKNVIYSMAALSDSNILTKDLLPERLDRTNEIDHICLPHGLPLEEVEKIYIEKTIEKMNDNKTKAAKVLGISKVTLFSKIKKYNEE